MNVLLDNLDLYASAFVGTVQLFLVSAVGSIVGGQVGATVGRRLPPNALRAVIVLVGVVAVASFLV